MELVILQKLQDEVDALTESLLHGADEIDVGIRAVQYCRRAALQRKVSLSIWGPIILSLSILNEDDDLVSCSHLDLRQLAPCSELIITISTYSLLLLSAPPPCRTRSHPQPS